MQRSTVRAGIDFLLGFAGRIQGPLGGDGGITFQPPVDGLDPFEHVSGQIGGRDRPCPDQGGDLGQAEKVQVVRQCGSGRRCGRRWRSFRARFA